jgi:hypothetical protein
MYVPVCVLGALYLYTRAQRSCASRLPPEGLLALAEGAHPPSAEQFVAMVLLPEAGNLSHYVFDWVRTASTMTARHRHDGQHVCIFIISKTFAKHNELNVTLPTIRERIIEPARAARLGTTVVAVSSFGEDWQDFDRSSTPAFDEVDMMAKVLAPASVQGLAVQQLSKTCAAVKLLRHRLSALKRHRCEWYVKTRPEFELLSEVAFTTYRHDAVNARVRYYRGPLRLQYGSSMGGPFTMENRRHMMFANMTEVVVADDMFYAVHADMAERAFESCDRYDRTGRARQDLGHVLQGELSTSRHWKEQLVDTQPIDLRAIFHCGHMCNDRGGHQVPSGPVNMPPNDWQRSFEPKEAPKGRVHISFPREDVGPVRFPPPSPISPRLAS